MLENTPNFERLRKALMLEGEPDGIPLVELWIDAGVKERFLGEHVGDFLGQLFDSAASEGYDLESDIKFWAQAGYDYAHIVADYTFPKKVHTARVKPGLYSGEARIEKAPVSKGSVLNLRDFEKHPWPTPKDIDFSRLDKAGKYLSEGMKIISGSLAGVYEESWMAMGSEVFLIAVHENPELVKAVIDKVGSIITDIFERVVKYDSVGALWISDDIAGNDGTFVSPDFLREYVFPWYRKITEIGRRHNLPVLFHSDGNLWAVMKDLIDIGFNALHPIQPEAMNIKELKEKVGDRICLLGGLGLDQPLCRGKPEEVTEAVKQLIRNIGPGGGYAIGSSNSITGSVPFENYMAMIEAVMKYGRYPIMI